jgi:hypothetical protein
MKLSRILDFTDYIKENSSETEQTNFLVDNFTSIKNNKEIYDAKEKDFESLPWFISIKKVSPEFKLDRVRKTSSAENEYSYTWYFSGKNSRGNEVKFKAVRPSSKFSFSNDTAKILAFDNPLVSSHKERIYLNDLENWNRVFMFLYFSLFSGSLRYSPQLSLSHILDLFSKNLHSLYKKGDLGIVGVRKDCSPYVGHYDSPIEMIQNLPPEILDKIKSEFIKKIKESPGEIQYAISQCQLPDSSTELDPNRREGLSSSARFYPKNEVLDFYNFLKVDGYVPPDGFESEVEKISDLLGSLGDVGL